MRRRAWLLAAATICMAAPSIASAQQPSLCPGGARSFSLYFAHGSADIDKESGYPILSYVWQQAQPNAHIYLNGHTDGSEPAGLGLARATAIAELFVREGLPSSRVTATGLGFSRPAVNVAGPEALNRRIEICTTP